jgi:hypothetical protein
MSVIAYTSGYKYQLSIDYGHDLPNNYPKVPHEIETQFLWLSEDGRLIVKSGYAWDGPSGPTIDTKNFMRGSLVHDALYQLIREGHLDKNVWRILADQELYRMVREDGMWWVRANFVYYAVRVFGNPSARSTGERPIEVAPRA